MRLTHYQLLGIPEDADEQTIRTAYRSMAKRFHPDANNGSEAAAELFRQINEAYRVLHDENLRRNYDRQTGCNQPKVENPAPPPGTKHKEKFNRFLNSVLDAIFDDQPNSPSDDRKPPVTKPSHSHHSARSKPDFNFYYYLAMERQQNRYIKTADGTYRNNSKKKARPHKTVQKKAST